jgi:Lrp/AsnC family leucine-responsive transcriptional regulator
MRIPAWQRQYAQESCTKMNMSAQPDLDSIDRRILQALQADGRLTFDELASRVGLSASAVLRRVRRLEETRVISGYVALVLPEAVGLGLTAYLNVRLEKHSEAHKRNPMDLFKAAVQAWPEVVECVSLTGEMDYLLRVVVVDMAHYARFIGDTLLRHPSVQDCKSSFVLERVKGTTAMPV